MRILVLSDTHIPSRASSLPGEVWREFQSADLVIHAGDLESVEILEEMEAVARELKAVRGNMDPPSLERRIPEMEILELQGIKLAVVHGHQWGRPRPTRVAQEMAGQADVVVYGHTHLPAIRQLGKILVINPGSPTSPRGHISPSYGIITMEKGDPRAEIIQLKD